MTTNIITLEEYNSTELSPRLKKLQEWQASLEYIKRDAVEEGDEEIAYFSDIMLLDIKEKISQ